MVINSIILNNCNELFKASLLYKIYNIEVFKKFTTELFDTYSRCNLCFNVSGMNIIDLFELKRYQGANIYIKNSALNNYYNEKSNPDLHETIDCINSLSDAISYDNTIDFTEWRPFIPVGSIQYNALVIFSGPSLMNFFTDVPTEFFTEYIKSDITEYSDKMLMKDYCEEYFDVEKIINKCSYIFYYDLILKNTERHFGTTDILNQTMNGLEYFDEFSSVVNDPEKSTAVMSKIVYPTGYVSFFNDDKSVYVNQLKELKKYYDSGIELESIYGYFVVSSSFEVFLDFAIGTNFISSSEPLKLMIDKTIDPYIPDELSNKYETRITELINNLCNIKKMSKDLSMEFKILNIQAGCNIKYILKIPFDKLNDDFYEITKNIFQDKEIVKYSDYRMEEILHILLVITELTSRINNFLNK